MRLATKAGRATCDSSAQSSPPNCEPVVLLPPGKIREIARQGGGYGGTKLPIERGKEIMIQNVPIDAHVIHELRDVSTLPR